MSGNEFKFTKKLRFQNPIFRQIMLRKFNVSELKDAKSCQLVVRPNNIFHNRRKSIVISRNFSIQQKNRDKTA